MVFASSNIIQIGKMIKLFSVKKCEVDEKNRNIVYVLGYTLIIILRVVIGDRLGVWIASTQYYDDALMINYADLFEHFHSLELPIRWNMVKEMTYPIFLNVVHWCGLKYSTCLSILWIIGAFCVRGALGLFTKSRRFLFIAFCFSLFCPAAFDLWLGTRMYRNVLIAPCVLIVFSLFIILDVTILKKRSYGTIISLFLGITFLATFYIKEDGIWLMACYLFNMLVTIMLCFFIYFKDKKRSLKDIGVAIFMFCIPLVIFVGGTQIYKNINYHFYGVYETNTRTNGELGEFCENIYCIASEDRTSVVWAPIDAIKKAFNVSATLQKHPQLLENIENSHWVGGDIYTTPIKGDFLTWVIRDALADTGIWKSEEQVQDMFRKVNEELRKGFSSGLLKKDDKFQLTSSMGGRNMQEILKLRKFIIEEYKSLLFLKGYEMGGRLTLEFNDNINDSATYYTNMNLFPLSEKITAKRQQEIDKVNVVVSIIFRLYSIMYPIMFGISVVAFFYISISQINRWRNKRAIDETKLSLCFIMAVLFGVSLMYTLSIAWFAEFIDESQRTLTLKFYSVGALPLLILFEIIGFYLFVSNIGSFLLRKYREAMGVF